MNELAKKIQQFISGKPHIKIVEDDYTNKVVDVNTDQIYGFVHLDEGRFEGYERIEIEDEDEQVTFDTPANITKIMETAQLFVQTFIERDVHFSMLLEWSENSYMVTYEERDPKLGVLLPHTGCTLYLTRDGFLSSANIGRTDIELEYPLIIISQEEAKKILRKAGYVQLAVQIPNQDEEDLDQMIELIYRSSHNIMGVGVDGQVETATEFMDIEEIPVREIQSIDTAATQEELLGVNQTLVKKAGEEDTVIWFDPTADIGEEEPLISSFPNTTGHFSYSNLPFEKVEDMEPLPIEKLTGKALEYLELVEGDIHEKFVLEEPLQDNNLDGLEDEEECDGEDEEDLEEYIILDSEPTQMFTLYREHQGVRIEGLEAHVHVGLYTGLIRECSVTSLSPTQAAKLNKLSMIPTISLLEAEERFFSEIEMKLSRTVKDFDDRNVYTLSYNVSFPRTGGHIEKMNAHTGEVSYVYTGIIKEEE
ncbi:hypothetical protein [Bacillus suaedae]|uniref:DUF4901 domain-containing protein n=1 Tax=Halalkalibacter suaedae TaxID=2822140 RepID=A0A941AR24_9BACI|nr:hypothetical protein [Bacillus suaedae]MBP3953532.1 hypothetical protein [Bacillus suaedae]